MTVILFGASANAGGLYGKYKMDFLGWGFGDTDSVVFLMNSEGKTKTIAGGDYMHEIESAPFFKQITLTFTTWGDEDHSTYVVTLEEVDDKIVVVSACGAFLDLKNEYAETFGKDKFVLSKWSKSKKEYKTVKNITTDASFDHCMAGLLDGYEHFDGL